MLRISARVSKFSLERPSWMFGPYLYGDVAVVWQGNRSFKLGRDLAAKVTDAV